MRGADRRDAISRVSQASHDYERQRSTTASEQSDRSEKPSVLTHFSDEALERARKLNDEDGSSRPDSLSREEEAELRKLKQRDQEVRSHEQAHKAAAGKLASGAASFSYRRGPDDQQYAVGGEVKIDVSPVAGDPEATIRKMRQVQSAARAPAQPSGTDLEVAASAVKAEAAARAELREEKASQRDAAAVSATSNHETQNGTPRPSGERSETRPLPAAYRSHDAGRSGGLLDLVA